MSTQKKLMTNYRWWICSLLFIATTVNYLDRQVLSLTYKEFIAPEFHWTDNDYGTITSLFSIVYAIACLFAGKFVDWMGTKKGYLIAIAVWSTGAIMHAGCGIATTWLVDGIDSVAALRAVEAGSNIALSVSTVSVYLFLMCRGILALGEGGNFPAAIKTTAEYFPKKDRAFATSIFNAGASVGALAAPLLIPPLAKGLGWEWAFVIIGGLGYIWMFLWQFMYDKPEKSKHVNEAELEYIHQDDAVEAARQAAKEGIKVCTIGMGMAEGAPIPEYTSRGRTSNYKRDHDGNVIMTHLSEQMMREIASAGKGVYVSGGSNSLNEITTLIEGLEKEEFDEAIFSAYESRFMYPLTAGLLCLLTEVLLYERRNRRWKLFKEQ